MPPTHPPSPVAHSRVGATGALHIQDFDELRALPAHRRKPALTNLMICDLNGPHRARARYAIGYAFILKRRRERERTYFTILAIVDVTQPIRYFFTYFEVAEKLVILCGGEDVKHLRMLNIKNRDSRLISTDGCCKT